MPLFFTCNYTKNSVNCRSKFNLFETTLPKPFIILGVDPGSGGALAFLDVNNHRLSVIDTPTYLQDSNGKSKKFVDHVGVGKAIKQFSPDHAVTEKVHSSPQQGVVSAFSFGRSYGVILGVLGALCVPIIETPPSTWKRAMCVSADKEQTVRRATSLMPQCAPVFWTRKKDTDRAEAALLALYGAALLGHKFTQPLEPF